MQIPVQTPKLPAVETGESPQAAVDFSRRQVNVAGASGIVLAGWTKTFKHLIISERDVTLPALVTAGFP